jgi:ankyrin repeat protein
MNYSSLTRKELIEICKSRLDSNGVRQISNCSSGTKDQFISRLKENDKLKIISEEKKSPARGRPKKQVSPKKEEVKKSPARGRPKKQVSPEKETVKKSPGRPKKQVPPEKETVKKSPGRPKKQVPPEKETVKKSPGRPKKQVPPEKETVKKYHGRPKKQVPPEKETVAKSPGSPKKLVSLEKEIVKKSPSHPSPKKEAVNQLVIDNNFLTAVNNNDIDMMKKLLDDGANINSKYKNGETALINASKNNYIKIVEELLNKGADPNLKDGEKWTALIWASYKRYTKIVEKLLNAGADVDLIDKSGDTALILASENGDIDIVQELLNKNADVNLYDNEGATALHVASLNDDTKMVELLIQSGADISVLSSNKQKEYEDIIKTAKPQKQVSSKKSTNKKKYTSRNFLNAIKHNDINSLLSMNIDLKDKDTIKEGILIASMKGYIDILKFLHNKGVDHTYFEEKKSKFDPYPFNQAVYGTQLGVLEELRENWKFSTDDLRVMDNDALFTAVDNDMLDIIQELHKWGLDKSDLRTINPNDEYPITIAAQKGYINLLEEFKDNWKFNKKDLKITYENDDDVVIIPILSAAVIGDQLETIKYLRETWKLTKKDLQAKDMNDFNEAIDEANENKEILTELKKWK